MSVQIERRGLIVSDAVHAELEKQPGKWIAFECCASEEGGGRYWKVLLVSETGNPEVLITRRNNVRVLKSADSVISLFEEYHRGCDFLDFPITPGEVGPRQHPGQAAQK